LNRLLPKAVLITASGFAHASFPEKIKNMSDPNNPNRDPFEGYMPEDDGLNSDSNLFENSTPEYEERIEVEPADDTNSELEANDAPAVEDDELDETAQI